MRNKDPTKTTKVDNIHDRYYVHWLTMNVVWPINGISILYKVIKYFISWT